MLLMNRRTFLKHSALSTTAVMTSHAAKGPVACGLGISTYGLQSMDLESAIKLVAATGYDCVEITAFEGEEEAFADEVGTGPGPELGRPLVQIHVRMQAGRLLEIRTRIERGLQDIQWPRIRRKKAKRIIV